MILAPIVGSEVSIRDMASDISSSCVSGHVSLTIALITSSLASLTLAYMDRKKIIN